MVGCGRQLLLRLGRGSRLRRRSHFTPGLTVGNAIQQGVTRIAAKMAQQTGGGIEIASIDQPHVPVVCKSQVHSQRRDPAGLVQSLNFPPEYNAAAQLEMRFVNLDDWPGNER